MDGLRERAMRGRVCRNDEVRGWRRMMWQRMAKIWADVALPGNGEKAQRRSRQCVDTVDAVD